MLAASLAMLQRDKVVARRFVVRATAEGFLDAEGGAGSPGAVVNLSLVKPSILELPLDGPRADAAVWLREGVAAERHVLEPTTAELPLHPGCGCLVLTRPGAVATRLALSLTPGQRLALRWPQWQAAAEVRGSVVDPDGTPLGGARVELIPVTATAADTNDPCAWAEDALGLRTALSSFDGTFVLSGVAAGSWRLRALRAGFAAAEQRIVVDLEEAKSIAPTITLRPAVALVVEVDTSRCGEEPPFELLLDREVITSVRAAERWKSERKATIGRELRTSWNDLLPGLYRLTLRKQGSDMAYLTMLDLSGNPDSHIVLRPAPITVQGVVRQEGKPVPDATITLFREGVQFSSTTDTQGSYEVSVWSPERYAMTVRPQGSDSFLPDFVDLRSASAGDVVEHDIELPSRTLTGVVLDRATKEPVAGAKVVIEEVRRNREMASQRFASTTTDGRFSAQLLSPDGKVSLTVEAEGYLPQKLGAGGGTELPAAIIVELERGEHVRGRVVGPAGEGVGSATVMLFADPFDRAATAAATTSVDGSFSVSARDGSLIWAVAQSYGLGVAVVSGGEVSVRLPGLGPPLDCVIKTSRGDPVAGIALTFMRTDGVVVPLRVLEIHALLHGGRTRTDHQGRVVLTGVPSGTYQALAVNLGGSMPLPLISLPAPRPVELRLPGP